MTIILDENEPEFIKKQFPDAHAVCLTDLDKLLLDDYHEWARRVYGQVHESAQLVLAEILERRG